MSSSKLSQLRLWRLNYTYSPTILTLGIIWKLYSWGWNSLIWPWLPVFAYNLYHIIPQPKLPGVKKYNAIVLGAGISGMGAGVKLDEMGLDYVILEKARDLGGTWWENRYPGAACDIPSHLYSYSYFPNPWWCREYAKRAEIQAYLMDFAAYFNLESKILYQHEAVKSVWNDKTQTWSVETKCGKTFRANFLISACGGIHKVNLPKFPGEEAFKGLRFHSAKWDEHLSVQGKSLGVIGTGASSVQIVPNVAHLVKDINVFQRSAAWVPPRMDAETPKWLMALYTVFPFMTTCKRWFVFLGREIRFPFVFTTRFPRLSKMIEGLITKWHKKQVKDPALAAKLLPDYQVGCKRIAPSDTYLKTFNRNNVHLVTDKIVRFSEDGIVVQDESNTEREVPLDMVVYATGFDPIGTLKAVPTFGQNGADMREEFGDHPSAFKGIAVAHQPNFFLLLGPNTGLSHNSIITVIECEINYTMAAIKHVIGRNERSLVVKSSSLAEDKSYIKDNLKSHVVTSGCESWYLNKEGFVVAIWPNSLISLWWYMLRCDPNDFDFQ
eukprot:maker-scaffold248_size238799-snap-gene-1.27 protein:Tk02151 transcript:maker-scaffold248_size238799-snap-gene-1.27-mRNA-1 annotation:"4-hydroxyacetophenone monooxygenase"